MSKRVCCLYRVSTDKQVDYDSNNEADIPMQRKACHKFADEKGWEIVHEEQEDGVSGHKVRAENRDKIQIIKDLARKKKFDVLLVFMFDRIGRIADETPFVVEWFVKNGIEVWSTQEGEQRFDNHIDKLLNYIRFWQADGESEKTSIRTRTSLGQMVEEGHYKGGSSPFGYDLVKNGRFNKKKHELYDLQINEAEAYVVRLIFDKYVDEGLGFQMIANWLTMHGYKPRLGEKWARNSIRNIIANPTYIGYLKSGETVSPHLPELQIVSDEKFEGAAAIRQQKAAAKAEESRVPLNMKGLSLLSGNVFCGHCGPRLHLTTNIKVTHYKDGSEKRKRRISYTCYKKSRKLSNCDGQTTYDMYKLDGVVDKMIREIFAKMKSVRKENIVSVRYSMELNGLQENLNEAKAEYEKELKKLNMLKDEIIRCLQGESDFTSAVLSELIAAGEDKCRELNGHCELLETEMKKAETIQNELYEKYDELISWADLYDSTTHEAKKMIVNKMIKRIEVCRDYKLRVEFNFDIQQFMHGLDCVGEVVEFKPAKAG